MAGFENDVLVCENVNFDTASPKPHNGIVTQNGELLIGASTAPFLRANRITSTGGTCTITNGPGTINIEASSTGDVQQLEGNTGGPIPPTGGIIDVVTANSTVEFVGSGSTLTQDFGLTNLILGSDGAITSGFFNVGLGQSALNSITSGTSNTCVGTAAGLSIDTGNNNTLIGAGAGDAITSAQDVVAIGVSALSGLTTNLGGGNIAVGARALDTLQTGSLNIAIGTDAGAAYTTTESSNIVIGNDGIIAETFTTRIGTNQTNCYLAGILHTTSGRTVKVTTPGAYPYTALTTDYVILVDTSAARTINLMASPATGTVLVIKDNVGSAAANNITIIPAAGNIDGSSSYTISTNYASVTLVYTGATWAVI